MDTITMTFPHVNNSVQVGDTTYYQNHNSTDIVQMGEVTAVTSTTVTTEISGTLTRPVAYTNANNPGSFILFSKNNTSNTSALRGYYAEVKMSNDDSTQCELYTVGSEVFESSK